MIDRCYLEITNICNLDCVFCPKTARPKRQMSLDEFDTLTDKLTGKVRFLYLHLMGEPMLHPDLDQMIGMARTKGFIPILTTNGTRCTGLNNWPYKIQISLHSQEANARGEIATYINRILDFATEGERHGSIIILRLWNQGGFDALNDKIHSLIAQRLPHPWTERHDGWKLSRRIYIEYDRLFEWPDARSRQFTPQDVFCYALRNQIGIHSCGTVVPCCLDHEGDIALGNLFDQDLDTILCTDRARRLYDGFTNHIAVEPLCQRCEYANVTKRYRNRK